MSTAIEVANSEIAFNLAETGNIFTELRSFFYVPQGTSIADEATARSGPFDIGLDPQGTDPMDREYGNEEDNTFMADVQKADVASPEIGAYLVDAASDERFGITGISEADAMTTTVKLLKHNKKIAGKNLR